MDSVRLYRVNIDHEGSVLVLYRSSAIVELLTTSAWKLLLRRVGDTVIYYLLNHTSIFIPLPRKKYHQVAGVSIIDLCPKFSQRVSDSDHQHLSHIHHGFRKKRKRVDKVDSTSEKHQSSSFGGDVPSSSICSIDYNDRNYSTPFSGTGRTNCCRNSLSTEPMVITGARDPNGECQESTKQTVAKPRKRLRQYSWQRHRKRRKLTNQGIYSLTPCTRTLCDKDNLSGRLQYESNATLGVCHEKRLTDCSCCLILRNLPEVIKGSQINRQTMFYKLECSSLVLPRKHILYSLKPNFSGANVLLKDIFGLSNANMSAQSFPCFHINDNCLSKSTCLYHSLVKLLKIVIRKARYCCHLRLLNKHCAIPSLDQNSIASDCSMFEGNESEPKSLEKKHHSVQLKGELPRDKFHSFDGKRCKRTSGANDHQFELSKYYCQKKQVVSFIWAACRSIVPLDLLGTPSNRRVLRRNISKFVHLRRFEKFSLKQCMHKYKISRFPLLSSEHSACYLHNEVLKCGNEQNADMPKGCAARDVARHKILECWIFWFFSCLVLPLLEANFYVTESELGKQEIFYYRKSSWEKLMNKAITTCMEDQMYQLLTEASVRKIVNNRLFGFSRVRLLPKDNGVRVLANLRAASRMPVEQSSWRVQSCSAKRNVSFRTRSDRYRYFKSVNTVLRGLHAVLKDVQMKEPEKLGSSVFNYNDVYQKLIPFLSSLKSGSNTLPGVFIVVSDVLKAFDSINQEKLLSVMKDVILNDEYFLVEFHEVFCAKKSLRVLKNLTPAEADIEAGWHNSDSSVTAGSLHSILVKQDSSRKRIGKAELYFNLGEHVKRNVLQLDKKCYLQMAGIPQGSVVSSLLCSFYFGHLEKNVIFPFLQKTCGPATKDLSGLAPKHMLLRFIDDFLFISTSKMQASSFLSRLHRGIREYNCYMNEDKFGLNFESDQIQGLKSERVYVGEDNISFLRWSGLFINCRTSEVQADYTSYLSSHLSSTLTVCWQGKPGRHLKEKLCDYLQPKCHPIFYDSNINSAAVVRLNIYQAFLLCAMKFHCYVRALSSTCRLNPKSYYDAIENALRYMHKLIKRRMHSVGLGSNFHPILELEKREVEWLGLMAFIRVLKRKQSRYKELLFSLRSKLMAHGKEENMSSKSLYAVDDSHSSLFWKIKY